MDWLFWRDMGWLAVVHIITPFIPMAFPIRVGTLIAMAALYPWLLVIAVADLAGVASAVVQYYLYRRMDLDRFWIRVRRYPRAVALFDRLARRRFLLVVALNGTPLPDFLISVYASVERYPIGRFALAMALGRLLHVLPVVLGGVTLAWFSAYLARHANVVAALALFLGEAVVPFILCLATVLFLRALWARVQRGSVR